MAVPTALEQLHPRNLEHAVVHLQRLVSTHLWAQIVAGMVLGIGLGVALGPSLGWVRPGFAHALGEWLALPGMLFLSLIQMIVIPLVVTAIIRGIAAVGLRRSSSMFARPYRSSWCRSERRSTWAEPRSIRG